MKKLLLLLFALVPLAGCASSGPGYGSGGGGGAYFYGDCLYLENCYDGVVEVSLPEIEVEVQKPGTRFTQIASYGRQQRTGPHHVATQWLALERLTEPQE